MKIFLDDKRDPPDDTWIVCRTAAQAIHTIRWWREIFMAPVDGFECPAFEAMMFDHDLGHCDSCTECKGWKDPCGCQCHWSGYVVACWMEIEDIWPDQMPTCHSQNPAGKAKIEAAIKRKWGIPL